MSNRHVLLALIVVGFLPVRNARAEDERPALFVKEIVTGKTGYSQLSCYFFPHAIPASYVVITGTSQESKEDHEIGYPDSATAQFFAAGAWHTVPDGRWCGMGIGAFHYVAKGGVVRFDLHDYRTLHELVSQFTNPADGFLIRGVFEIDAIDTEKGTVTALLLRSPVAFVRLKDGRLDLVTRTLDSPESDAEAQELLVQMQEEPNQHPRSTVAGDRG
jgi:hypothetical protein